MGLTQIQLLAVYSVAVVLAVAATFASGDDIILQKRSERNAGDVEPYVGGDRPEKRPFCNAFTGCGRKRADESMDTLVDLGSEPAVQELRKEILSEAKLWEAIQEAKAEMERHRDDGQNMRNLPLALAMSNYRRKRAAAAAAAAAALDQKFTNRRVASEQRSER